MKCVSNFSVETEQDLKNFFLDNLRLPNHRRVEEIRVPAKFAREILKNNLTMIIDGQVKWFIIKNLGLGVYSVSLNNDTKETIYVT